MHPMLAYKYLCCHFRAESHCITHYTSMDTGGDDPLLCYPGRGMEHTDTYMYNTENGINDKETSCKMVSKLSARDLL